MTTVYAVSSGSYSDYGIDAIFSTKENAQAYMDYCKKSKTYNDFNDIEEYELDQNIEEIKARIPCWSVTMARDGKVLNIYGKGDPDTYETFDIDGNLFTYVFANDKEHAIKIVNEKRIWYLANNKWPEPVKR